MQTTFITIVRSNEMNGFVVRGLLAALCVISLGALLSAKEAASAAAPTSIKLADGKKVPIVTVAALNAAPKDHEGLIAIDGQVGEVWGDKGRFMLVDYGVGHCEDENCTGCAADQQVPIRYDKTKAKGVQPKKEQKVYVIAVCKTTETGGFTLEVREVRAGDKVLMTVKS
jgi:hypothetical protein